MIKKVMSLSMSINIQKMLNKISKNIIKRLSKNENDKNKKNHMKIQTYELITASPASSLF